MNNDKCENLFISGLCSDSRRVKPGDLFIAVQGEAADGRKFINQAIEKGAEAVLSEPLESLEALASLKSLKSQKSRESLDPVKPFPIIEFSDLKNALGFIAARYFNDPSALMKVIGVTGTNGKTTISHFIAELLHHLGKSCGIIGTLGAGFLNNLNSFGLTTPDPILLQEKLEQLRCKGAEFIAMEVTSHALAQARVAGTQFHTAIFTNLTRDHLDFHGTLEEYFNAKQKLFTEYKPKNIVINVDDPYGQELARKLNRRETTQETSDKSSQKTQLLFITTESEVPDFFKDKEFKDPLIITTHSLQMTRAGTKARIKTPWGEGELFCPLLGKFNFSNILASIAAICLEGNILNTFSFDHILSAVSLLKPVPGRMHLLGGHNEPSIVIDYAHSPDALAKVLSSLRPLVQGKLIVIFGCGGERDPGKRPQMAAVAESMSDQIIVTQDNPRTEDPNTIITDILEGFSQELKEFQSDTLRIEPDRAYAIQSAVLAASPNDIVVIAGKGHEMEQIVGQKHIPFSDEDHAKEALIKRQKQTSRSKDQETR